jgi:hypothetical protein
MSKHECGAPSKKTKATKAFEEYASRVDPQDAMPGALGLLRAAWQADIQEYIERCVDEPARKDLHQGEMGPTSPIATASIASLMALYGEVGVSEDQWKGLVLRLARTMVRGPMRALKRMTWPELEAWAASRRRIGWSASALKWAADAANSSVATAFDAGQQWADTDRCDDCGGRAHSMEECPAHEDPSPLAPSVLVHYVTDSPTLLSPILCRVERTGATSVASRLFAVTCPNCQHILEKRFKLEGGPFRPGPGLDAPQCLATTHDRASGNETQCRLRDGHGRHDDGCLSWEDGMSEELEKVITHAVGAVNNVRAAQRNAKRIMDARLHAGDAVKAIYDAEIEAGRVLPDLLDAMKASIEFPAPIQWDLTTPSGEALHPSTMDQRESGTGGQYACCGKLAYIRGRPGPHAEGCDGRGKRRI